MDKFVNLYFIYINQSVSFIFNPHNCPQYLTEKGNRIPDSTKALFSFGNKHAKEDCTPKKRKRIPFTENPLNKP